MNQAPCLVQRKLSQNRQTKFFQNFQNLGKNHIFFSKYEKYFFLKSIQNCLKRILNRKSRNRFCTGGPGDRSIFSSIRPTKGPFGAFCRPYVGCCRPHEMGHIPKGYYLPFMVDFLALFSISANFCHILMNFLQIFIDFKMSSGRNISWNHHIIKNYRLLLSAPILHKRQPRLVP